MIPLETWLKTFGFDRNPFESTEAGSEDYYATQFLHDTFVKPECFDRILGQVSYPKSTLVFAPRGSGKSSARVMLAHFCREGLVPMGNDQQPSGKNYTRVLPVLHNQFQQIENIEPVPSKLVDGHVTEILGRGTLELSKAITTYPDVAEQVAKMEVLRRLELQSYFLLFSSYLPFDSFKTARQYLGNEIILTNEQQRPIGFAPSVREQTLGGLNLKEIDLLLFARTGTSLVDLLSRFADLVSDLGFGAVYILIDGLDETWATANDYASAARLIAPLLANLQLMNATPKLAFKLFAPTEVRSYLLDSSQKVRRDRLMIEEIRWDNISLQELLHRRLASCSGETVSSLDAVSLPEMRGRIDLELVQRASGIPRRLILMGENALRVRCEAALAEDSETYLLTEADLDRADTYVKAEYKALQPVQIQSAEPEKVEIISPAKEDEREDWPRHELPAPIALANLVYQRESIAHVRIWKMYELVEVTLAFLSQVLLAHLYQGLNENTPLQLKKNGLRLDLTSLGVWRTTLEKLPGMLSGLEIRSPFARACQRFVNKNVDFIRVINDERNRSAHGGPQSEETCETLIEQYAHPLQQYLMELSFLRECHLIKVLQIQKHDDKFLHRCILYVGDAAVFPTINVEYNLPLDSDCLWFLGGDGPLNLHSLMLVTSDRNRLGEDVWLYQGIDSSKGKVIYKSYGTGQKSDFPNRLQEISGVIGS